MSAAAALTAEDYAFSRLIAYSAYQWPAYADAPHHRLIARHLEAVERGDIKRLMITMPPRHGKSMLASEFFPAWYMGRNPDHYVVTATYAQELADDFGRKVKNQIEDPAFQGIFPGVGLADDSKSAKRFHVEGIGYGGVEQTTHQRGAFYAVGVGGPLTGRGAHLLLIDDPVKNREDAESEIIRKKTKDWYTSTAYTRLMPGGRIVIIQCMTGDTEVMMMDGAHKPLRDVRPGDCVASYADGHLVDAKVVKWANQGPDRIFAIRTTSGITVKANERHPFLVGRGGKQEWVRLKHLKVGDALLRVIGENGAVSPAHPIGALSRQNAADTVCPTITKRGGHLGCDLLRSMPNQEGLRILSTDTASLLMSMKEYSPVREDAAPYAVSLREITSEPIGAESSASIIATTVDELGGFSATTATWLSDTEKQRQSCLQHLNTFGVSPDRIVSIEPFGVEDVFDLQIEGTENFIANGLVSHNTRWHEDDLSGWLQAEHKHEGWTVLNLPAINDDGDALWPEQYPLEELERIKLALPPRDWHALYQQRPSPETGDYFKREWLITVEEQHIPPRETMLIYGGSDYAVTADGGDYTVHAIIGVASDGRMFLLDLWRAQASSDVWVEAFCSLVRKWKPIGWAEESGQIKSGVGPFLVKRMIETESFVAREQFATRGDKAIRAQSIRGRMALQGLHVPRDAPWLSDFIAELMSFPVGVHDDQVDAIGLVGQLMDKMANGATPKAEERRDVRRTAPSTLSHVRAPAIPMGRRH